MKSAKLLQTISLVTVFLLGASKAFSQNPLPDTAFDRMVIRDITLAIVGENTPVTGVKIDVSKPEGTISGMFPLRKGTSPWIFSFELKGGVTDKNFSFFKGFDNANSAYEFKPSFHYIPARSYASYGDTPQATINKRIVLAKNSIVAAHTKKLIDTFYVITQLYNHHLNPAGDTMPLPPGITKTNKDHNLIAAYLIPKIVGNPALTFPSDSIWEMILDTLPRTKLNKDALIDSTIFLDPVIELYRKYKKLYDNRNNDQLDKVIANASTLWTLKTYKWYTATPFVRTEKVNEYYTKHEGKDSLYIKPDYRWYYGISVFRNWYHVWPKRGIALLYRAGVSLSHNNNLATLTPYNYETKTPFFQNGTSVTEKNKTGTAYNNVDIKTGFDKQLTGEAYLLPLASMVPGAYLAATVSHSDLFKLPTIVGRDNDKIRVSIEGGPVFNINNREKDKTFLSILVYFRYEDLTDKRRTSVQTGIRESKEDFQKRNIGMGVKVGIPINLPKREE